MGWYADSYPQIIRTLVLYIFFSVSGLLLLALAFLLSFD